MKEMNRREEESDYELVFNADDYEQHKDEKHDSSAEDEDDGEKVEEEEAGINTNRSYDVQLGSSWPQSYRLSMDMFANVSTTNIGHEGTSWGASGITTSCYRRQYTAELDPTLTKPFIPTTTSKSNNDEALKSTQRLSSYEPSPSQKCSFTQSFINGMNVLCGVGLLSTPYAIKEGGWTGLIFLFAFGVISCYTGIMLKRCLDSSPEILTYPDIGESAFGTIGRLTIAIVLYVELYAAAVEYLTLMSDNLSSIFPNVEKNFFGVHLNSHYFFSLVTTLAILPTVWLRNLSLLSYLSVGGVISSSLVSLCLLWVGAVDKVGFHPSGTAFEPTNYPIALGLFSACYGGHSVFPNIYTSMEKPSQFPTVLIMCFTTCWLLYTGVAVCGYMMFGDSLKSQFTLNMPTQFGATQVAVWTTVVNPLSKYALTMFPVALSLEELMPSASSHGTSITIRTLLVFSTLVVSLTVPFFGLVMALIGSFCTILVALIFPCACYLALLAHKLSRLEIGVNVFIIVVGAICCSIGTYSAVSRIIQEFSI